jgi:hypothetical protein
MTKKQWQRKHISTALVLAAAESCPRPIDAVVMFLGCPRKVAVAAFERELDKGYIEYGVSIDTAWITDEGSEYLDKEDQG